MSLKNCPNCNLVLFDTDTACIYCGWSENKSELNEEETDKKQSVVNQESPENVQNQTKEEQVDEVPHEKIQRKTDINAEAETDAPIAGSKIPVSEYAKGERWLNGKAFNIYEMIEKHGIKSHAEIIQDIRTIVKTDYETAKAVYMSGAREYLKSKRNQPDALPEEDETPTDNLYDDAYTIMAYDLIRKHGPERKIEIIKELMHTVHIDLTNAKVIVDNAIDNYIKNNSHLN